jgi:hypothetical protein
MENTKNIQHEVAKRIQACLKEIGFDAETRLSEHEGIVFARKDIQGQCVRVVTHISDREVKTENSGAIAAEVARTRLAMAAIRPTLAAQAASRFTPEPPAAAEDCK